MRTRNTVKEELVKEKALSMIVKEGFEGFSVNKLAKICGISVATLYVYYKDKDDLIIQLAAEQGRQMADAVLKDFNPDDPFEEGLRTQWLNRYRHMMDNPSAGIFLEQLRSSGYQQFFFDSFLDDFKRILGAFLDNAIAHGVINPMPVEVYWSVAFAPLYNLIRFHNEGQSLGGKPFKLTDEIIWQTFDLVIKALKK